MHKKIGPFQFWRNWGHETFGEARYFGAMVRLRSVRLDIGLSRGELRCQRPGKWVADGPPKQRLSFAIDVTEIAGEPG